MILLSFLYPVALALILAIAMFSLWCKLIPESNDDLLDSLRVLGWRTPPPPLEVFAAAAVPNSWSQLMLRGWWIEAAAAAAAGDEDLNLAAAAAAGLLDRSFLPTNKPGEWLLESRRQGLELLLLLLLQLVWFSPKLVARDFLLIWKKKKKKS